MESNTPGLQPEDNASRDIPTPKIAAPKTVARKKEERRRRLEMTAAAIGFLAVIVITFVQLNMFYAGDRLFVALFNINFVLLMCVLVIVVRNVFKLVMERRKHVLGSGLRARLVLAFVGLTLLPCVLMLLVTTKYVQVSMDFWFKEQIETSMDLALTVGRDVYDRTEQRLLTSGRGLAAEISQTGLEEQADAVVFWEQKRRDYAIPYLGLAKSGKTLVEAVPENTPRDIFVSALATMQFADAAAVAGAAENTLPTAFSGQNGTRTYTALVPGFAGDYIVCAVPVPEQDGLFILVAENLGAGFKAKVDRIARGASEYSGLRDIKKPLKRLLYSSLGVLTALIMLGAVWVAFRMAKQISAPVLAVAQGAERVSQGDLSVRLDDSATDELAVLVASFNKMAEDLEKSRKEITGINTTLEEQNKKIARHSKYVETVLDSIAAGVVSLDAAGRVITMNKAATEMLSAFPGFVVGKRAEDVLPEPQATMASAVQKQFSRKIKTRGQYTFPLTVHGEEVRLLVNVVGFSADGVYSGSVAVFEDISELERMQRMAAWREVARRIAHEIKNPLTPIKLSAERLARKFGSQVEDPVFIQSTQLIVKQVEHLQNMVQEFSAFAKMPEVSLQPGSIAALIASVVEFFRNSHSKIRWEIDISKDLPEIPLDMEAMNRVFMNLCTNAVEALSLQTGNTDPWVRISASLVPDMSLVRVDVEDNGPGLSEEARNRIFEPYFTHKKGGTGLGMVIVRSIITDHRGYVRALPRTGGGLVVSIELPLG